MKKVYVVSGVSGSGKDTFIAKMHEEIIARLYTRESGLPTTSAVSADDFFYKRGEYCFDPTKLSEAHGACFRNFIDSLRQGTDLVWVNNTNTTIAEISPYMLGAQAYGYQAEIIYLRCGSWDEVDACAKRNTHNAPFASVQAQHRRLENLHGYAIPGESNNCRTQLLPHWECTVHWAPIFKSKYERKIEK
jgi:predicted kinase